MIKESIKGYPNQYHRTYWTTDGLHCYNSVMDCSSCPLRTYGISRATGCKQPEANQEILSKGVPTDIVSKVEYRKRRNEVTRRKAAAQ